MSEPADPPFRERYGRWAVVAGASEGIGAVYARAMAERGLDLVLLARRREPLERLAADLRADTGVQVRVVPVDLSEPDAAATVFAATAGLEVGMLMYCAGADPNYAPLLSGPVESALALVRRNCAAPLTLCHHFAGDMARRGRGALVVLTSVTGLYGAPNMVAYSATKAFDLVMTEALWAELRGHGVDVLALVLGTTDTPALRRALTERGLLDPEDTTPVAGAVTAEEVVAEAIANLSNGPTWFVGDQIREFARRLALRTRSEAVGVLARHSDSVVAGSE
ncbi:SDR family NAD(P)-dependent oxidoreductase [Nocardia bovistercoris]|uniref:SDR family NAD(P)-dependent oxidoreductase n=1 Tax=Nocardia bovistercoris TaxID=2785916 RepID=A0A931N279_9NOCA|nr:SDR family NAD(P)-dependent oxidoreductase [Nocardia bovistercoris]